MLQVITILLVQSACVAAGLGEDVLWNQKRPIRTLSKPVVAAMLSLDAVGV